MRTLFRAFAILEWISVLLVVGGLLYLGLAARQHFVGQKHRAEAIQSLASIEKTQRYFHRQYGFYGLLEQIWPQGLTAQGHYAIQIDSLGASAYRAVAIARNAQLNDKPCREISLTVNQNQVLRSPAMCWG